MSPQPPPPDPLGRELVGLITAALGLDLSAYERQALARLLLYSDRPDVELLAGLIRSAIDQAVSRAVEGTLFDQS
jgi:hypothetical protein